MVVILMLWNFSFGIGYYKVLKDKESQNRIKTVYVDNLSKARESFKISVCSTCQN